MADITANVDAWSSTEASNAPTGATTVGTGLDDNIRAIQAGIKVWAARFPFASGELLNGRVTASVAANALTLAIKGKDGNDPSSTNKVYAAFRSGTASSSDWNIREITAALSVVVSSGSTLGHASGILQHLFVYLVDNAGTVEMAVSNLPPDYPGTFLGTRLISTTAEGGAGAADSATGIYSSTARTNVPWVCVAMCKSNQVTAGTWATAPAQIDMTPFTIPTCAWGTSASAAQSVNNNTVTKRTFSTENRDPDGIYDAVTNYRAQPHVAGDYSISAADNSGGGTALDAGEFYLVAIYKNGAAYAENIVTSGATTTNHAPSISVVVNANGTTDYFEVFVHQTSGVALTPEGGNRSAFSGHRI